jgi:hypothetical protein
MYLDRVYGVVGALTPRPFDAVGLDFTVSATVPRPQLRQEAESFILQIASVNSVGTLGPVYIDAGLLGPNVPAERRVQFMADLQGVVGHLVSVGLVGRGSQLVQGLCLVNP